MWQVFRAELRNNIWVVAGVVAMMGITFTATLVDGPDGLPGSTDAYRSMLVSTTIIFFFICLIHWQKEKRERWLAQQPLAAGARALARYLLLWTWWGVNLAGFYVASGAVRRGLPLSAVLDGLILTGFVLMAAAMVWIYRDLMHCGARPGRRPWLVTGFTLAVIAMYFCYILAFVHWDFLAPLDPLRQDLAAVEPTVGLALLSLTAGVGMAAVSVRVYVRRRDYLE
jgi:hypothetical protein